MPRNLNKEFMDDLASGLLRLILKEVREEGMTLDFQIRENEVHIYYRGGKILGMQPNLTAPGYVFSFDANYFLHGEAIPLPSSIVAEEKDVRVWLDMLPFLKRAIDRSQSQVSENAEREFQQVVSRENTYSGTANQSDYFIVDIEYQTSKGLPKGRATKFDLMGILWSAEAAKRRSATKQRPRLALFEMKYGDDALTKESGMVDHLKNTLRFAQKEGALQKLKEEIVSVFQQKRDLGLVRFGKDTNPAKIVELSDDPPQFIFLLAAHAPRRTVLRRTLNSQEFQQHHKALSAFMDVRFAVANFMGYGLYESCMLTLDEFMQRLEAQSK